MKGARGCLGKHPHYLSFWSIRGYYLPLRRRNGGAVDRGGLENRCTAMYRGFESLFLRVGGHAFSGKGGDGGEGGGVFPISGLEFPISASG